MEGHREKKRGESKHRKMNGEKGRLREEGGVYRRFGK